MDLWVEGQPASETLPLLDRACERLSHRAPQLYSEAYTPPPRRPDAHVAQALSGIALIWLALLAWGLPRRVEPWAWAVVGIMVRVGLAPPRIFMGEA